MATAMIIAPCNRFIARPWQLGHLICQRGNSVPHLWQYQIILAINIASLRFAGESGELRMFNASTPPEVCTRLVHQPEMGGATSVRARKIFQSNLIENY